MQAKHSSTGELARFLFGHAHPWTSVPLHRLLPHHYCEYATTFAPKSGPFSCSWERRVLADGTLMPVATSPSPPPSTSLSPLASDVSYHQFTRSTLKRQEASAPSFRQYPREPILAVAPTRTPSISHLSWYQSSTRTDRSRRFALRARVAWHL